MAGRNRFSMPILFGQMTLRTSELLPCRNSSRMYMYTSLSKREVHGLVCVSLGLLRASDIIHPVSYISHNIVHVVTRSALQRSHLRTAAESGVRIRHSCVADFPGADLTRVSAVYSGRFVGDNWD